MRIILYTGKGGVGKTSIAAATAVKSAAAGHKTLAISTDPAHSLGDSFDRKLNSEPQELVPNLWAQEIDPIHEAEQGWGKVQQYLTTLFTAKTVKDITTEELTVFPGMEDLLSLLRILKYYRDKTYDVIVVDCASSGETLALLSFPEMFRWWMDKLFPIKRKAIKLLKPIAEPVLGVPMPSDNVMGEIENVYNQLNEMRQLLSDRDITTVRLVVNPEKMVIKETQRSFTYLNLYDIPVDAVVVNRVIPDSVNDPYFSAWKDIQKKYRQIIDDSFAPVPIFVSPLFEQEVVGIEMLRKMADTIFSDHDPVAIHYRTRTQQICKEGDNYTLALYMPFTDKADLSLNLKGEELIIKAGHIKRNIILPRTLINHKVLGAKFESEMLKISFGGIDHG